MSENIKATKDQKLEIATTTDTIRINQHGDASVLRWETDIPLNALAANEVQIKIAYAGVNYIDTYHRTGLYAVSLPFRVGREASGVVSGVGSGVTGFGVGDRVAFHGGGGSYSRYINIPASSVLPVPNGVSLLTASASMLQGATAHYLTHDTFKVTKGTTVLVHAAAGGTGQLIVQLALSLGGRVLCTVGSSSKAALVSSLGVPAADIINYSTTANWADRVRELTGGEGVHAVYDGVGKATYEGSMKALKKRGFLVLFGNASGAVPPIDPLTLTRFGSIYVTRPTLVDYSLSRAEVEYRVRDIFEHIQRGTLKISVGAVFDVSQAAEAHTALESRAVAGKIILKVDDTLDRINTQ